MLGDHIQIRSDYFTTATAICEQLRSSLPWRAAKMVVGIAGESGSGKSVTAVCLQKVLADYGRKALILHQDDYFKLPPQSNHEQRVKDLSWIGPSEVRLDLIALTIKAFLNNQSEIEVPLVHYSANQILSEVMQLQGYDLLIVEGTYALHVDNIDYAIFMDRTFQETHLQRLERGREKPSAFIEQVLAIEHQIIRPQKSKAQLVVDKEYKVRLHNTKA